MSLPGWMLSASLAAVIAAGLAARQTSRSARPWEMRDAPNRAAPALPIQRPRSLDAAPISAFAPSLASSLKPVETKTTAAIRRVSPMPSSASAASTAPASLPRSPASSSAGAAMLSAAAGVGGRGAALGMGAAGAGAAGAAGAFFADDYTDKSAGNAAQSGRERTARAGKNGKRGAASDAMEAELGARWQSPHYEDWTPASLYGPPLPPERTNAQIQAHRLLQDMAAGRLSVMMDERDGEQLRCLERDGVYAWPAPPPGVVSRSPRQRDALEGTLENTPADDPPLSSGGAGAKRQVALNLRAEKQGNGLLASRGTVPRRSPTGNPADDPDFNPCALPPSPGLLRLLTTLAAHSTPARPLRVMSLLRPPYRYGGFVHVGPANPHSLGLAVDIAAYGGYEVRQSEPEQCVAATLALLRALPPGHYRLGLPKAPEGGWPIPPALASLLRRAETASAVASPAALTSRTETSFAEDAPADSSMGATSSVAKRSRRSRTGSSNDPTGITDTSEASGEGAQSTAGTSAATGGATAALYGLHISGAKPVWPFFPPPYTELVEDAKSEEMAASPPKDTLSLFAAQDSGADTKTAVKTAFRLQVTRFQNEAYAPESGLADARLRRALEMARQRGVDIIALFPDGADHIHVDARQNP